MATLKLSRNLRGGLTGLAALVATSAAFGGEAEGVVRIRSNDQPAQLIIRGQSPCDCVPCAPKLSKTPSSGAPAGLMVISPKPAPAPEPKVSQTDGEAAAASAPAAATGEFSELFSEPSVTPFDKPQPFPETSSTGSTSGEEEGIALVGHRRQERKMEKQMQKDCPEICPSNTCPPQSCPQNCPPMYTEYCPDAHCGRVVFGNNPLADKLRCHCINHRIRSQQSSDALARMFHDECNEKFNWFRCKFGYFFPSGTCGKGSAIAGHYSMVYPVNPSYSDPRDCQVYAAQGYYGPVAVPLAPVVHHTYNYGWGVPSSRLTPVGNPVAPY